MSSVGLTSPRVRQSQAQPPSRRGCHGAPLLHTGPGAAPPSAPLSPLEVLSTLPSSSPPSVICQDVRGADLGQRNRSFLPPTHTPTQVAPRTFPTRIWNPSLSM